MPTIYDNIEHHLLDRLRQMLQRARSADSCVGYFNLRGWGSLADIVSDRFEGGEGHCVRVLVGMHRTPEEEMREAQRAVRKQALLDGPTAVRRLAREGAILALKARRQWRVKRNLVDQWMNNRQCKMSTLQLALSTQTVAPWDDPAFLAKCES